MYAVSQPEDVIGSYITIPLWSYNMRIPEKLSVHVAIYVARIPQLNNKKIISDFPRKCIIFEMIE